MAKLHRHLVVSTLDVVQKILTAGDSAEHLLQATLKSNPRWGSRDRKFVSETVYELIRHWRKWWFLADLPEEGYAKPTHDQVWLAWAGYRQEKGEILPAFPELDGIEPGQITARLDLPRSLAIQESIPDWWNAKGERDHGDAWPQVLAALNQPAPVYLRTNTLRATREKLLANLAKSEISATPVPKTTTAVRLEQRVRLADQHFWKEGWAEVQDLGSQGIGEMLPVFPEMRVVDLCAGAGGKTLQLAARMNNSGQVLACDVVERKLIELDTRCERAGVTNVQTHLLPEPLPKAWQGTADTVLIDAPCSGSGVLRRQPDTKWKLTAARLAELQLLQAELLEQAHTIVKPGGTLLYATCSLFSEENGQQIQQFLAKHPSVKLVAEKTWLPHQADTDGFYAALLQCS